jgi:hypothetical protein
MVYCPPVPSSNSTAKKRSSLARNMPHEGYPTTVGRMVKQRLASATVSAAFPGHNLSTVDDMMAGLAQ